MTILRDRDLFLLPACVVCRKKNPLFSFWYPAFSFWSLFFPAGLSFSLWSPPSTSDGATRMTTTTPSQGNQQRRRMKGISVRSLIFMFYPHGTAASKHVQWHKTPSVACGFPVQNRSIRVGHNCQEQELTHILIILLGNPHAMAGLSERSVIWGFGSEMEPEMDFFRLVIFQWDD